MYSILWGVSAKKKKTSVQYYSKLSRETGKCFQEKPGEGEIVKNLEIF